MSATDKDVIIISELPLNKWTNDFKSDFLEHNLSVKGGHIEEFFDDGDEHTIRLEVHMEEGALAMIRRGRGGVLNWFNMESDVNLTNMVLYTKNRVINKYNTVQEIFHEFFTVRLEHYRLRKEWMLKKLEHDKLLAMNKKNFIEMQINGTLTVHRKDLRNVNAELKQLKFTTQTQFNKLKDELEKNLKSIVVEEEEDDDMTGSKSKDNIDNDFD